MNTGETFLRDLRAAGFTLRLVARDRLVVSPASRLTPMQRGTIELLLDDLLWLLAHENWLSQVWRANDDH